MVPNTELASAVATICALGVSLVGFSLKFTSRSVVIESEIVAGLKTTVIVQLSPAASVVVQALAAVSSMSSGEFNGVTATPVAADPPLLVNV